jgi:hypothetical protein
MMPKTPQPAKKAKVDVKEPKSAPAKMGKGIPSLWPDLPPSSPACLPEDSQA